MKRFATFAAYDYNPHGGWCDFWGFADTLEEARALVEREWWWQVVDLNLGKVVDANDRGRDYLSGHPELRAFPEEASEG